MGIIPDFAFGLTLQGGSRRHFVVEIDRGTMPVVRSDTFRQTSFEEKMRAYLTAHAAGQHERQFGWKTFRLLTVTTDHHRMQSMMEALRALRIPHSPGAIFLHGFECHLDCLLGDLLSGSAVRHRRKTC